MKKINIESCSDIKKPSFVIDKATIIENITKMVKKASDSATILRPHFKTHQNHAVGRLFRDQGIDKITASSLDMALYFAEDGWNDITVAVPVNILQIDEINSLAKNITLNLVVESEEAVSFLGENLKHGVNLLMKVDTGYGRAGIYFKNTDRILSVANKIKDSENVKFTGLLAHSGHTYYEREPAGIRKIFTETNDNLLCVKKFLEGEGFSGLLTSVGDTPSCSVVEKFEGIDEVRPGNFVYFDVTQTVIGSCRVEDIGCAVACPVIAKHEEKGEVILYGGGVHLSKEFLADENGVSYFGLAAYPGGDEFVELIENSKLYSISQEHGKLKVDPAAMARLNIGDLVMVLPIHSCMSADLLKDSTVFV